MPLRSKINACVCIQVFSFFLFWRRYQKAFFTYQCFFTLRARLTSGCLPFARIFIFHIPPLAQLGPSV